MWRLELDSIGHRSTNRSTDTLMRCRRYSTSVYLAARSVEKKSSCSPHGSTSTTSVQTFDQSDGEKYRRTRHDDDRKERIPRFKEKAVYFLRKEPLYRSSRIACNLCSFRKLRQDLDLLVRKSDDKYLIDLRVMLHRQKASRIT